MLAWKTWFDLRVRFCYALTILTLIMIMVLWSYPIISKIPDGKFSQLPKDYQHYISYVFFYGNVFLTLLTVSVILASSGFLEEKKNGTLSMTLSLPIPRWQWLAMHAGICALLNLVLALISVLALYIGSYFLGQSYSIALSFKAVGGIWLGCFFWLGCTLFVNSYLHSAIKSICIILPVSYGMPTLIAWVMPAAAKYYPSDLPNPEYWQQHPFPWATVSVFILIGVFGIALTILKVTREDY